MKFTSSLLPAAAVLMMLAGTGYAQPSPSNPEPTVYFDPNDQGNTTSGGAGDFATSDFWNPSTMTDGPFVSGTNGVGTLTFGEGAVFNGPASTVTVSAPVSPDYIQVGVTSGTETFGNPGDSEITLPVGHANNNPPSGPPNQDPGNIATIPVTSDFYNPITIGAGSENVVFNSGVNLAEFNRYYNISNTVNSSTTGNVAFNGGITFTNNVNAATSDDLVQGNGEPNMGLSGVAGGTFTINSAVTAVNSNGSITGIYGNATPYVGLETNNTLILTSGASFSGTNLIISAGTALDQGATYSDAPSGARQILVGGTGQYLTDVPNMTVTGGVQFINGGGFVGSALAADTTYSGQIVGYSGADMNLTSGAGGRVNFTGDVINGNNLGIDKVGVGTVNMHNANPDGTQVNGNLQVGPWEIKNGTLLLNGTVAANTAITGSQLTIDAISPGSISSTQTYATLGGIGSTNVPVVSAGGSSIISPGDPEVNGGIGTLGLFGGVTSTMGITLNFNINGALNSVLDLGAGTLSLAGTTHVDFTNLGTVNVWTPTDANYYSLLEGSGSWTTSPTFDINAPAGYVVDHEIYNATSHTFEVDFRAVPEPSTYALMIGGLAFLAFCVRRKNRIV